MGRLSLLFLVLVVLQLVASSHPQHDHQLKNCHCKACYCLKPHPHPHPPCHKPPDHKPPCHKPPHWPPQHKPPHKPPPDHKPPPHKPPPHKPPPHKPPPHKPHPVPPPFCAGKKECAVAKIRAKTLLIPLSSTLRNKVKEQIDRRLELFGLGNLKNCIEVEVKSILLSRYVIVRISAKCCPKILQIVLDALTGPQLSTLVVRPPSVVKYCSSKREPCSLGGGHKSVEDAPAVAAEGTQEENVENTTDENESNSEVSNDEVSNEVSDSDNTTSQTEEEQGGESEEKKL